MNWLAIALLVASCASIDTHFTIEDTSAGEGHAPVSVSVVGVIKNGRMNERAWEDFGPRMIPLFGSAPCELGFSERLRDEDEDLYVKLDTAMKDDGITNDSMAALAPRARGQLLVAFTLYGALPARVPRPNVHAQTTAPTTNKRSGRRARQLADEHAAPTDALQMSMAIYSVKRQQIVTSVAMRYNGESVDEAFRHFDEKLRTFLPAASCTGWTWK